MKRLKQLDMEIDTSIISKHRSAIMGVAILWVMAFHLVSKGNSFCDFSFASPVMGIGYGGVDIFLFTSGIGLYFSYCKNSDYLSFIKKRLIRIFPAYIIINIIYGILNKLSFSVIIMNISTIGFWTLSSYYDWYIPSMMIFYLLFPVVFKNATAQYEQCLPGKCLRNPLLILSTIIVLAIILLPLIMGIRVDDPRMFFVSRIPIFILGTAFGTLVYNHCFVSLNQYLLLMIFGLAILFYVRNQSYVVIPLAGGCISALVLSHNSRFMSLDSMGIGKIVCV